MDNETDEYFAEDWSEFVKIALGEESFASKVIFSAMLLFVFTASVIGNLVTCIVIYYDKTMHTATNYYLFNLAISDLLVTFSILLMVYQVLNNNIDLFEFKNGGITCKLFICIHYIFVNLLWNNGILVMTALSIERYIAICYPMMLSCKPVWRRVGKIMAAIWTIAILETLPQFWTVDIVEIDKTLKCFSLPTPTTRLLAGISGVTTFIIPLGILIFVYTMIAFRINDNQKNNLKHTVYNNGFKRKNVNKLIALTVSFVVCWLPYFLVKMIMFSTDVHKLKFYGWYAVAHKIALFNSWFTTVLNPLLFSLMSIKFRKALKMLWERKIKKYYETNTRNVMGNQDKNQHLDI